MEKYLIEVPHKAESLRGKGYSPQNLSYVIPLLSEEGFCSSNMKKPYMITKC